MAGTITGFLPCCPGSHSGPLLLGRSQTPADMLQDTNTGVILNCMEGKKKTEFNHKNMNVISTRLPDQCPHSQT